MNAVWQQLARELRVGDEHPLQAAHDRSVEVDDRRVILGGERRHQIRVPPHDNVVPALEHLRARHIVIGEGWMSVSLTPGTSFVSRSRMCR